MRVSVWPLVIVILTLPALGYRQPVARARSSGTPVVKPVAGGVQWLTHPRKGICKGKQVGRAPLIVVSMHGAIYTITADGRNLCRITDYAMPRPNASPPGYANTIGAASNPHLSPTGRQIAYLTTTSTDSHDVWIVPTEGATGGPRRLTMTSRTVDRAAPSWSPGGRFLAYHEGNPAGKGSPASYAGASVVVRRIDGSRFATVLRLKFAVKGSPNAFSFGQDGPAIAWSPDGRKIATIIGFVPGPSYPVGLNVGIATIRTGHTRTVTIRFPKGILTRAPSSPKQFPPFGSFPSGDGLAWTADSRHLVISTIGRGAGGSLTGLWRVAQTGGIAQLFVGTQSDIKEHMPASPVVNGATGFLFSPNLRRLATDPDNRFWVAGASGQHGHFTNTYIPRGCVLAQYTWLPDSSGLAYVTECTVPSSGSILLRLNLYTVKLGASPRPSLGVIDREPDALDLAPARRCVACG